MTLSAKSQKMIDAYLTALGRQLRDLMDEDVRDIVEELRAHILDKTSTEASPESVAATLSALGTPEQLAIRYRTEELLERARFSRSGVVILRRFLRWAAVSLAGLVVFLISARRLWHRGISGLAGCYEGHRASKDQRRSPIQQPHLVRQLSVRWASHRT